MTKQFDMTLFLTSSPSYLLQTDDHAVLCGEAYRISGGEIVQISTDGERYPL